MDIMMSMIVTFMLITIIGAVYSCIKSRRIGKIVIPIGGLFLFLLVYVSFLHIQCRSLKKQGFYYEKVRAGQGYLEDVFFFFKSSNGEEIEGPLVSGDDLKINCRDVDGDGIAEFIIQSRLYQTYKVILKVDIETGNYHVEYRQGLNIDYPQEGYHFL